MRTMASGIWLLPRQWAAPTCLLVVIAASGAQAASGAVAMRVARNIPYAGVPGVVPNLNSLDVYAPRVGRDHPIVVYVHGGGWCRGDKGHVRTKPQFFVGAGYVFVSINYRLTPRVKHPAHVQDVAKAIAWIHAHAKQYGGDPDHITLLGHSAGAHLSALVAADEKYLKDRGLTLKAIKTVVLLDGGGYDIPLLSRLNERLIRRVYEPVFGNGPTGWKEASPITHVAAGKHIPRFLLIHAGRRAVSRIQAERFAQALRGAGVPAGVVHAPDKTHATLNQALGKAGDEPSRQILAFLNSYGQNRN